MTDAQFFADVLKIAEAKEPPRPETIERLKRHLWHPKNWTRLRETAHGKFFREVVTVVPDLLLRAQYRRELIQAQKS
jgi:hypothetical protein